MLHKITNRNVTGKMCNEIVCENDSVNFVEIDVNGIKIFIQLCQKHSDIYEDYEWKGD